MTKVIIEGNSYVTDSLYQWDTNQDLVIRGLSLPTVPEIHFTNADMDRAIVRQSTMDEAGIITARIPNSLLQKPYKIKAYVCIYEGDTFRSLYQITIPVQARNMPLDYKLTVSDDEVYSFNALENKLENTLAVALDRYDRMEAISTAVVEETRQLKESAEASAREAEVISQNVEAQYQNVLAEVISAQSSASQAINARNEAIISQGKAEKALEDLQELMNYIESGGEVSF